MITDYTDVYKYTVFTLVKLELYVLKFQNIKFCVFENTGIVVHTFLRNEFYSFKVLSKCLKTF